MAESVRYRRDGTVTREPIELLDAPAPSPAADDPVVKAARTPKAKEAQA